jgi:branched-subunit amino acid aminotransferase/4-amino-4-deoxychorismate lyase
MIVFFNDKFIEEEDAVARVKNRGMYFGEGIFETMRAENGNIIFLQQHLSRFLSSAGFFSLPVSYTFDELRTIIITLLHKNSLADATVRITLNGGVLQAGENFSSRPTSSLLYIETKHYTRTFPEESAICFASFPLLHGDKLRLHKTTQCLRNIVEARAAYDRGFDEVIFTDEQLHILEGSRTNIFLIRENKILTPSHVCGILPGVMRNVIAEICSEHSLLFEERIILRNEIEEADEIFLTNAVNGVVPVKALENKRYEKNERTSALQHYLHEKKRRTMP